MDTKILEYLIAVAEEQNISRAAERCHISQPALSQHIKQLEKQLNVALFTRHGHSVSPTDYGKVYLNNARAILRVETQTLEKIRALKTSRELSLTIISSEEVKAVLENSILPHLKEQYSNLDITLLSGSADIAISYLLKNMADIGIFYTAKPLPDELEGSTIVRREFAVAVPKTHPLAARESITLEECRDDSFLLGSPHSELGDAQQQVLDSFSFSPQILYHVDKLSTVAHMVSNGVGISLLPTRLAEEYQFDYKTIPLDPPWKFETVAAFSRAIPLGECASTLLNILRDYYR